MDAQHHEVDRGEQVGHGFQIQAVEHDEQTDDGVEDTADAQSVHVGKEGFVRFPVKRFVVVNEVVLDGQQRQHDALNGKGQTRDGLPLVIITDFGLRHHVHHAERQ